MNLPGSVSFLVTHDNEGLAQLLREEAHDVKVHDLIVELSPTRGFRVVREGNTAQGVLLSRHAMIGLLACLYAMTAPTPAAFWKEVLS
jgi:hypothetical protein